MAAWICTTQRISNLYLRVCHLLSDVDHSVAGRLPPHFTLARLNHKGIRAYIATIPILPHHISILILPYGACVTSPHIFTAALIFFFRSMGKNGIHCPLRFLSQNKMNFRNLFHNILRKILPRSKSIHTFPLIFPPSK